MRSMLASLVPGAPALLPFLLLFVLLFAGILAWTWLPGRKAGLDAESRLPFNDQENENAR